jgi:hypothetical protein
VRLKHLFVVASVIGLLAGTAAPVAGGTALDVQGASSPDSQCATVPAVPSSEKRHNHVGVATFGMLEAVHAEGKNLQVVQEGLDDRTPKGQGSGVDSFAHQLPVGGIGNHLQVKVVDETVICIGGAMASMSDLEQVVGQTVIVAGTLDGSDLKAIFVSDLAASDNPLPADAAAATAAGSAAGDAAAATGGDAGTVTPSTVSMCLGQDMTFDRLRYVRQFQGCFGGPSASDTYDLGIPFFCPFIGCFVLDTFSYTAGLAGWGFDFPFGFSATGATPTLGRSTLTYHVPGTITTQISPQDATDGHFTFSGGLGLYIGLNVDFCSFWGCSDLGTIPISAFSMMHRATGAGPLTGQTMEVKEVACPNFAEIGIDDIPFVYAIALKACVDLAFTGRPFHAAVTATANGTMESARYSYGPDARTMAVTPNGVDASVQWDNLSWTPQLDLGLYFKVAFLAGLASTRITPTIPLASGDFPAISNPFPSSGSAMTLATDPNGWGYLVQPTSTSIGLTVAPAPTTLSFISSDTLAVGQPVQARLVESWSQAPVVGETVTLTAGSNTAAAVTDANGIARWTLPVGKYTLSAAYAGSAYFEPATASQSPVWVYLPTQFGIWGANPGGTPVGARFTFLSNQWSRQVLSGSYTADSSFKGWAGTVAATGWVNAPASVGMRLPEALPDYIGVFVTTSAWMHGSQAEGNVAGWRVLKVDAPSTYKPDPGHLMSGVLETAVH